MLCYKDMTFCSSDCAKSDCYRYFGEEQRIAAREWWGNDNAPVLMANFSQKCADYRKESK